MFWLTVQMGDAAMTIAKTITMSAAVMMIASMAFAAEVTNSGKITKVDKASGTVTIEHGLAPGNTVGSAAPGKTFVYDYKVPDAAALSSLQVGDKVHFTAQESGQIWTATKIQKQ
jgi:Cu/Ag efflux protein CusF